MPNPIARRHPRPPPGHTPLDPGVSNKHPPRFSFAMADYRNFSRANPSKGAADNVVPVVLLLLSRAFCSIDLLPMKF